ncbi:MAG TPA: type II toxin-antitoxin system HipA family toxin [Myxococcales bacterium]|nr:type II toxin-antitoxin system HipA family toxin [Myxococcales bacterium]
MSERRHEVCLSDTLVGLLSQNADGLTQFRFHEDYCRDPSHPVLSQSFEDDLERTYAGNAPGALPGYFANLLPEGELRRVHQGTWKDAADNDLSLLGLLGHDLPGAVVVRGSPPTQTHAPLPASEVQQELSKEIDHGLRFSLAGVQLKFSMLARNRGLTLPGHGEHGDWIVKLGNARFPGLVENEHATMEWARACGFDVPEVRLTPAELLEGLPRRLAPDGSSVFAIRRFDRPAAGVRVHQEDFAQVMARTRAPRGSGRYKYDGKLESIAVLVSALMGSEAYLELVRRVVFVLASGNFDAHLKNWSLTYPDGRTPHLAPLYDQTCTVVWPEHDRELALKLAGTRRATEVDERLLRLFARKAGEDEEQTLLVARQTAERARETFAAEMAPRMQLDSHRAALVEHWRRVPLLRAAGTL